MARQIGNYKVEGTLDGLCFYKMEGEYYVRKQSSLTGKRFWKAACFANSRESCERLAMGSQLAAMVYKTFHKQQGLYAALKTKAIALLKENQTEEDVVRLLLWYAAELQPVKICSARRTKLSRVRKKKAKTVASLFILPPINRRMDYFNCYLSSA